MPDRVVGLNLQTLTSTFTDPTAVVDPDGRALAVNDGWREEQAAYSSALLRMHPLAAAEREVRLDDGSLARLRIVPLPVEAGRLWLVTFAGTGQAGTSSLDEGWVRVLVDAIDEAFIIQDRSGQVLAGNRAAREILGLEDGSPKPWNLEDQHAVHGDGSPIPADQLPMAMTFRTGEPCTDVTFGLRQATGETTWLRANTHPVVRSGETEPYAVVSAFRDVSSAIAAEREAARERQRLAAVVASMPSGVLVELADGRVALTNDRLCELFGLSPPGTELVGHLARDVLQVLARLTERPNTVLTRLDALRAAAETVIGEELELDDGRTLECDFHTIRTGDGTTEAVWVFRDATGRKQDERLMADARDAAVEASRTKSELLATLGHEIRTPMSGIVGMVDLLLSLRLDDQVREVVEGVRLSAESLIDLLNDMLDLARLEAGRLQLETAPLNLRDVLEGALAALGARARDKGLLLAAHVSPDVPDPVLSDPVRLRQIVVNLVGNAVKFTAHGGVVCRALVAAAGRSRRELVIEVSDTGPGLAERDQARIFQAFVQAAPSTARQHGGSGLGLAITAQIVALMGGRLEVDSELGTGSTFRVRVPLRTPRTPRTKSKPPARSDVALAGKRVRLWTAVPAVTEALAAELADQGATVERAATARELTMSNRPADAIVWTEDLSSKSARRRAHSIVALLAGAGTDRGEVGFPQAIALTHTRQTRSKSFPARTLSMPFRREQLVGALAEEQRPQHQEATVEPLRVEGRVLLAEDNRVNLMVLSRMLNLLGVSFDSATDGDEAAKAALAGDYALVLIDIHMRHLDGLQATRWIRAAEQVGGSGSRLPIVALTASSDRNDRAACLTAGMDDFLTKPITLAELRSLLVRFLAAPGPALAPGQGSLDPAAWEELAGHLGEKVMRETATIYLTELPARRAALHEAAEAGDRAALYDNAHGLKSSSAMLGAGELAGVLARIESGSAQDDLPCLRSLCRQVDALAEVAGAEIERRTSLAD